MTERRRRGVAAVIAVVVGAVVFLGLLAGGGAVAAGQAGGGSAAASLAAAAPVHPGRPCADPVETQGYKPGPGWLEPEHTGIDFVCLGDHTVVAIIPGTVATVVRSGCPVGDAAAGYGCNVVVRSDVGGRDLYVRYGHGVQGSQAVAVGDSVAAGAALELEGSSGWSTGPHVHVEVDDGAPAPAASIDPAPFLDPEILAR